MFDLREDQRPVFGPCGRDRATNPPNSSWRAFGFPPLRLAIVLTRLAPTRFSSNSTVVAGPEGRRRAGP